MFGSQIVLGKKIKENDFLIFSLLFKMRKSYI